MQENQTSKTSMPSPYDQGVWIIYDGDCPVCHLVSHAYRLRQEFGALNLLNARDVDQHQFLLDTVNERQYDLDEGMVILQNNEFYHGAEAIWFMAKYGNRKNLFSLLCAILFSSKTIAKILYPFLRAGRNTLLWIRRKNKINNLNK